jgi:hypothetical protein
MLLGLFYVRGIGGVSWLGFWFMSASKILFGKIAESSFRWFCFLYICRIFLWCLGVLLCFVDVE